MTNPTPGTATQIKQETDPLFDAIFASGGNMPIPQILFKLAQINEVITNHTRNETDNG
jgi:hypothetical protein